MKTIRRSARLALAAVLLAACQGPARAPTAAPVTLRFTYWGSPVEKEAIERMVAAFEAANPDIQVEARHIANSEYLAQVAAMIANGTPPDVGYLFETHAPQWASDGKLLDLTDIIAADPALSARLPETFYYFGPGRQLGTSTAVEIMLLFYNREVFDRAGLPYPPSSPAAAWDWDEFVDAARRLTTDAAGRHPGDPDFDPEQIVTYGVSFETGLWYGYLPFIYSNGGEVVNEAGTGLLLDQPAAVEAVQRLFDLMWAHHVMPTPEQQRQLPASDVLMQTGQLAMDIRGQWKLLDYASMEGLDYGVAVLPQMQQPKTIILGSPTVIFAGTPHLDAAARFYKFHNDPQAVDLYARGLWMPLEQKYYSDPQAMALWLDNPAHPPEAREALVDYTLCCAARSPHFYVKNFGEITTEVIQPAMDAIWSGRATVGAALSQATAAAAPMLAGRWDR